jgi:hypothetical protein
LTPRSEKFIGKERSSLGVDAAQRQDASTGLIGSPSAQWPAHRDVARKSALLVLSPLPFFMERIGRMLSMLPCEAAAHE